MIELKGTTKTGLKFILRPIKKGDEASIAKYGNNKKIGINLTDEFPHPYTLKEAKKWIKLNQTKEMQKTNFAIVVNKEVIGCTGISLKKDNERKTAEIGYWIGEPFWGQGIVTEVAKIITKYAFKTFDLERVQAKVFEYNPASARVLEKTGFKYEGTLRNNSIKNKKICSELVYSKLRKENK